MAGVSGWDGRVCGRIRGRVEIGGRTRVRDRRDACLKLSDRELKRKTEPGWTLVSVQSHEGQRLCGCEAGAGYHGASVWPWE